MFKRVILAGGGHAHLAVLADWARRPFDGTERWLVTSARQTAYSGMLPGWMAGLYPAGDILIDLKPLAERAGARLILADVIGLDASARRLALSNGETAEFDLLSLATGGEIDSAPLAALGARLLPVRPVDGFMQGWRHFLETCRQAQMVRLAVVGGGAAGVELALAADAALRRRFSRRHVALITPETGFLAGHGPRARRLAGAELAARGIEVHHARATGEADGLRLSTGTHLAADGVIAATGSRAPGWLAGSGLACDEHGFVAVGADLRSLSHEAIFAAGDIVNRADRQLPRSGVHAVKAGPVLAANLRAALGDGPMHQYQPRGRTLYLMATGDGQAILSWGQFAAKGRLAFRLKDHIDRGFVARHSAAVPAPAESLKGMVR